MGDRLPRRLAAILYADVVGYSRLTGKDEDATHRTLSKYLDLIAASVQSNRGQVMHYAGDAVLAKFDAVVDALSSAVSIQTEISKRNQDVPPDNQLQFRIGVNLGDVIEDRGDIYGDGVNVAARLESLAEPGGICVSESVRLTLGDKLPLEYQCMGEQEVKNIAHPVMAYRASLPDQTPREHSPRRPPSKGLPQKPSIAVLPFVNMSDDAAQEYFSDGITEDIITELSRFQNLVVIARNSSFTYKGKATKAQDVAADLSVQYIVEGSVRKAGKRVRLNVQLIEGETGSHIWAERYDKELVDIFEIQDELTQAIVAALPRRIENANVERLKRSSPTDWGIYDRLQQVKFLHHRGSRDDNERATRLLDETIEIDSDFAPAWAWKACVISQGLGRGYIEWSDELLSDVYEWIRKGYSIDENDLECIRLMCEGSMELSEWDEARIFSDKALRLTPNDPRIVAQRGELLTWLGESEKAVSWIQRAMQLDPHYANDWAHLLGQALFGGKRYEDAIQAFLRIRSPKYAHHAYLAACYALLGLGEDARSHLEKTLELKPDFSTRDFVAPGYPPPMYKNEEDRNHLLIALRNAGFPE